MRIAHNPFKRTRLRLHPDDVGRFRGSDEMAIRARIARDGVFLDGAKSERTRFHTQIEQGARLGFTIACDQLTSPLAPAWDHLTAIAS
jgi:hypothetical protein